MAAKIARVPAAASAQAIADALRATHGDLYGAVEWLRPFSDAAAQAGLRRLAYAWCTHFRKTRRSAVRVKLIGSRIIVIRDRVAK